MDEREIFVFCYWNGCIKYGPNGIYYEGSTRRVIRVKCKTEFNRLLDRLYLITGLDKQRSRLDIIGRYPSVVRDSTVKYVGLPVANDRRLKLMLDVPIIHPCIINVELYLQGNGEFGNGITHKEVSRLWFDVHEFRVGLRFKDMLELKRAVDWRSIKDRQFCRVQENEKDECTFECIRWKCKWSLCAARMEEHGCFEITKYTGPHTCCPEDPYANGSEFEADEIERAVKVQPTLSVLELKKWWKEKFGYCFEMEAVKRKVITKIYGDWNHSFRVMPKLMSAFQASNGLLVDWRYDLFPNTDFASFRGVFWTFPQSVEGFSHCRPLIAVDSVSGNYPMVLMIALGVDATNKYFPLAFAVTTEVSTDNWRWFLGRIREKVTQREGLCLITSPDPDILDVISEFGSQWKEPLAYHRLSLEHLCAQFDSVFQDYYLEKLVFEAGSTSSKEVFDSCMNDIKEKNVEARRWLDKMPPHQWALAHDNGRRYGIMSLRPSSHYAFFSNGLSMTGAVLVLFDELRSSFDESLSSSRGSLNRGDVYTKPVMDKIEQFMRGSFTYVITPLDRDAFQVVEVSENDEWTVQLNDSICTCGEFQAYKFPCLHALAVCDKLKINPLQYVDECYTLERYYKTYSAKFNHVPEVSAWPEAHGAPILVPPMIAPSPPRALGKSQCKTNIRTSENK